MSGCAGGSGARSLCCATTVNEKLALNFNFRSLLYLVKHYERVDKRKKSVKCHSQQNFKLQEVVPPTTLACVYLQKEFGTTCVHVHENKLQ